jgi:hypothetical protein
MLHMWWLVFFDLVSSTGSTVQIREPEELRQLIPGKAMMISPWPFFTVNMKFWLVVDLPLWKIWKSVGMMTFTIYGKIYKMFQTTNQNMCLLWQIQRTDWPTKQGFPINDRRALWPNDRSVWGPASMFNRNNEPIIQSLLMKECLTSVKPSTCWSPIFQWVLSSF